MENVTVIKKAALKLLDKLKEQVMTDCSDEEIEEFKQGISNDTIGNNILYNPRTDKHLQTIRIQLSSRAKTRLVE